MKTLTDAHEGRPCISPLDSCCDTIEIRYHCECHRHMLLGPILTHFAPTSSCIKTQCPHVYDTTTFMCSTSSTDTQHPCSVRVRAAVHVHMLDPRCVPLDASRVGCGSSIGHPTLSTVPAQPHPCHRASQRFSKPDMNCKTLLMQRKRKPI